MPHPTVSPGAPSTSASPSRTDRCADILSPFPVLEHPRNHDHGLSEGPALFGGFWAVISVDWTLISCRTIRRVDLATMWQTHAQAAPSLFAWLTQQEHISGIALLT